ncbi:unnamed protein product [Phytophthora lilii]|uniref:Unnamed protein product n=1 Tax=Phytophthora lilii TaxID=2077276 RepID=A0A9W6XR38_9STRA|nr:unnamed protein product [Phytophthora lilii]
MDYLFLGETYGTTKYVLVLKDELTHFCELIPADSANSEVVVASILDWFKRFGLPESWESDNGSHFKSEVMASLCERLKAQQAFVPVYTPWINGTVERLNRDILQVLRAMLLEFQLDTRNWLYLLPLIQASLNHSPVASLGTAPPSRSSQDASPISTGHDYCAIGQGHKTGTSGPGACECPSRETAA